MEEIFRRGIKMMIIYPSRLCADIKHQTNSKYFLLLTSYCSLPTAFFRLLTSDGMIMLGVGRYNSNPTQMDLRQDWSMILEDYSFSSLVIDLPLQGLYKEM